MPMPRSDSTLSPTQQLAGHIAWDKSWKLIFKRAHLKFMVYGQNQAYTHFRKYSPASVGLTHAHPNKPS